MATKKQIIESQRFGRRADLLTALLEDGKDYDVKQVERLINRYDKKEVK